MVALGSFNRRVGAGSPRRASLGRGGLSQNAGMGTGLKTIHGAGSSIGSQCQSGSFSQIQSVKKTNVSKRKKLGFYDALVGQKTQEVVSTQEDNKIKWGGYKSKQARKNVEIHVGEGVREGQIKTKKRGDKTVINISDKERVSGRFLDKFLSTTSEKLGEKSFRSLSSRERKKLKRGMKQAINNAGEGRNITAKDLF